MAVDRRTSHSRLASFQIRIHAPVACTNLIDVDKSYITGNHTLLSCLATA